MEIRSFTDLGAPKVGEGRMIEGYAIVFNTESRVMYDTEKKRFFTEIIDKGAVTDELLRSCDIKAVLEHDKTRLLARSRNGQGSLQLTIDDYGLKYRFEAPKTVDGDFLLEMVKRGDIFGSSFAYYTSEGDKSKVSYSKNGDKILRSVHKIDFIGDVSPVINPAYFGTDVTVRSLEDALPQQKTDESYKLKLDNLRKQI